MIRTRRMLMLAAAVTLAVAATVSAQTVDTSKRIKVAMVPKLVGLSVFKANQQGAEAAAKTLNIDFLYTGPVTASAQGQVDVFNSLIARKFDVITTTSNNPTQLAPALRRAMKQGIKVVSYDSDVAPDARDFFIQNTEYPAFGKALVDSVAKYIPADSEVAILSSTKDATIQNEWISALTAYMKTAYPKMKIVTGIFNVFHLLPPAAGQFLKQITEKVIELETSLRRTTIVHSESRLSNTCACIQKIHGTISRQI